MKAIKLIQMICELKRNVELVSVVEAAGIELKRSGTRHCGLCPFHSEQTPSFYIFQDNHYKCFGCGAHGDAIDFVQKMYGLSFQDALKHLGIHEGRITPQVRRDIQQRRHKTELVKQFKDWISHYTAHTGSLIIETERLMSNDIPPGDIDLYAPLLHMLPVCHYHLSILVDGDDKEKFELYKDREAHKWKKTLI